MINLENENFFPLLLEEITDEDAAEVEFIREYLYDLCIVRGFPLHPVLCWNALCWNFDLDTGRYIDTPLDHLQHVRHNTAVTALPVGAFIQVPAGGGREDFWGEIVYKEGRSVSLDDWDVESRFSGAPAEAREDGGETFSILKEALVVDFECIEEPWGQGLERERQKELVIDSRHHLVVDARYADEEADLDDATYFARWMVRHLREPLVQGRFGAALSDEALQDDDLLLVAVVASISVLRDIMATIPRCTMWRDFLFATVHYEDHLRPAVEDHPLGLSDLRTIANQLAKLHPHDSIRYASLGSRLVGIAGSGADLNGCAWVMAICYASHFIVQWLGEYAADGWYSSPNGTVHVRLDDAWVAGGIWRTERIGDSPSAYCAIPADIPLGLGYLESTNPFDIAKEEDVELVLTSSQVSITIALTNTDIQESRLRLRREMADAIFEEVGEDLHSRLDVEGKTLEPADVIHHVSLHRNDGDVVSLRGIEWPIPFVPGSRVKVVWVRGSQVVDVSLSRRSEPFVIGAFTYEYECDERLFARGTGIVEPPSAKGRTLRDLVLDVIRRRGNDVDSGCKEVAFSRVVVGIYGPDAPASAKASVQLTLDGLVTSEILVFDGVSYTWCPGERRETRVGDVLLRDYSDYVPRYVRPHEVRIFLRHLSKSEQASNEKQAQYREDWTREGEPMGLPKDLPDGFTYVKSHSRKSRRDRLSTEEEDS